MGKMAVFPFNVDTLAGGEIHFDRFGVERRRHRFSIASGGLRR
jgi:hypothetical protein